MLNKSEILKKLIQEYDVKTTRDVQEMLKDLFAETIQEMLEAELDEHLGYDRYDNKKFRRSYSCLYWVPFYKARFFQFFRRFCKWGLEKS